MSEKQYMLTDFDNDVEMLEKINEQQSLIQSLKEEIRLLKPTNIEQYEQIVQLQDEIDKLKKDIDIYEYEEKKHSETVRKLYEENEQLKERRDYWSKKTKEFIYYFNCLEKAIEKTFDSDGQCFEEIWKHYDEMEKKWEYNDSFVGNWTDKPVLLERKMVNINENRDKQRLLAKQGKGISRRE